MNSKSMIVCLLGLLLGMVVVGGAEKLVPFLNEGEVIANSYIVVFHPEVSFQTVSQLAVEYNVRHTLRIGSFKAFGGELSLEGLNKLRSRSDLIKYIEADKIMRTTYATQSNATWGLDRVDQVNLPLDSLYKYYESAGAGVDAYIIDTGILTKHEEFAGRAVSGYDFHNDKPEAEDDNGHGTHVASTVGGKQYGLAKNVRLVAVKTLGRLGAGSLLNVARGVEWAAQQHNSQPGKKSVANMSLGGGATQVLDDAVAAAISQGLIVVAASGNNDGDACDNSPARVPTAITVNAMNRNDTRASFSNWGSCTHIFAPGQDITGAWITDETSYRTISGTSMACPHVAGAVAVLLGEQGPLSPADAKKIILERASKDLIKDLKGSPNLLLFSSFQ